MATGYIVWDKKNKVIVSGPFASSADATVFLNRAGRRNDSKHTERSSKDQQSNFTIETVTV